MFVAGVIHATRFNKNYHFSWLAVGKNTKWDWEGARNYCRKFCMDSISIETKAEKNWVKSLIKKEDLHYIWTGGRKCNFKGKLPQPFSTLRCNIFCFKAVTARTSSRLLRTVGTGLPPGRGSQPRGSAATASGATRGAWRRGSQTTGSRDRGARTRRASVS